MIGVFQALKWVLREIFGYAGDHGWKAVYVSEPVTLITGEVASGNLMMRLRKTKPEYRRERPRDRVGAHLNDLTDV